MRKFNFAKQISVLTLVWVMLMLPMAVTAQTKVKMPKNKYKIADDVKIGNEYSQKVDNEFPILNDRQATQYVQDVGRRLVNSIPREFQQSAFNYRFKVVNARDINAFALPGGPMYVNRGMIEAAKNEGEMAGVMAHEISHVALRHGTAQATKQSSIGNQILGIGAILGGAILGGQAGAQLGAMFAAGYQLRYSRRYEADADVLGARILADAGYDPRDLANMFKTISQQSEGGRPPEWLSSHPDPDKRYETINREAQMLRVSPDPIKYTREFARVKERLQAMPQARTMAEIEKDAKNNPNSGNSGGGANSEMSRGTYSRNVPLPSSRTQTYQGGQIFKVDVPSNWKQFPGQSDIWFAPEGAYGKDGITHGATIGLYKSQKRDLAGATEEYVNGILQANTYLRQSTGYSSFTLDGRTAYATRLSGRSPVTGQNEYAMIYTTQLRNGDLMYIVGVASQSDSYRYNRVFNNMVRSIEINRSA
jgi:hypothetical protein